MTRSRSSQSGLSLVEVVIVISVMAVLSGVMAPAGLELASQARAFRVQQDCQSIRTALLSMVQDLGRTSLQVNGTSGLRVDLLVSGGATPDVDAPGDARWTRDIDGSGTVDLLERHLVTNEPAGGSYPLPTVAGSLGWRGSYLAEAPGSDPWGHRYAVNVKYLGKRPDVLVISAGPDGIIQTPYETNNLSFGGDDVAVLVK